MSKLREISKPKPSPRFKLAGCRRCGGDAFLDLLDEAEWRCLQCGRAVPAETGTYASAVNGNYYKTVAGRAA
jgi:hypothetical protein